MADLAGEVLAELGVEGGSGYTALSVPYPGEEIVNITIGTLTLREVLIAGLAKREGWLAEYPFIIIEDALAAEGVDLDATLVVFLND